MIIITTILLIWDYYSWINAHPKVIYMPVCYNLKYEKEINRDARFVIIDTFDNEYIFITKKLYKNKPKNKDRKI